MDGTGEVHDVEPGSLPMDAQGAVGLSLLYSNLSMAPTASGSATSLFTNVQDRPRSNDIANDAFAAWF
jgi:hypothetical protein